MRLNILKDNVHSEVRLPRKKLEALAEIIGEQEGAIANSEVNLIVTGDERVRELNKQYRQLDKTTDVLSFTLERNEFSGLIGEIYISVPRAKEQASEFHHSLSTELLRLTCHGLFHVLGYDHDNDETAETMEALELAALANLTLALSASN